MLLQYDFTLKFSVATNCVHGLRDESIPITRAGAAPVRKLCIILVLNIILLLQKTNIVKKYTLKTLYH